MRVKEIRYGRTYYLGNFQTERIEVMAEVEADVDPSSILSELRNFCDENSKASQRKKSGNPIAVVDEGGVSDELTKRLAEATKATRRKGASGKSKAKE